MAITRITNNIILDGTILPAKLNVSANLRTFLGDATSANLAVAVSGTTGSGNLVFATNPTLTNPTIIGDISSNGAAVAGAAMTIRSTTSQQYVARFIGQNASYAGFSVVSTNAASKPFIQFGIGAESAADFTILQDSSTALSIRGGNALGGALLTITSSANIGINNASPNTKAALDITSTTKGFLPPRMTLSNRTTLSSSGTVPEGLIVYTTDNALKSKTITLYNGSDWDSVLTTRADSFTTSDLAAALSDGETGSGQLVLATNPTLSGANVTGTLAVTDSITIGGVTAAKVVDPVRTTLTGDGTTDTFAISGATGLTNPSALIVAVDGSLQEPGADYSVSSGNIIFTSPLESGAKAVVISPVNTVQVGQVVPSDGSVTSAKIANSVTLTTPTFTGSAARANGQNIMPATGDEIINFDSLIVASQYMWAWRQGEILNTVTGSAGTNVGGFHLTGTTPNSSAYSRYFLSGGYPAYICQGSLPYGNLNWTRRIVLTGAIAIPSDIKSSAAVIRVTLGEAIANTTPRDLTNRGVGLKITGTEIRLMVHNGSTLTIGSAVGTLTAAAQYFRIDSFNGTVNLYINNTLVATSVLGPTGTTYGHEALTSQTENGNVSENQQFWFTQPKIWTL